MGAQSKLLSNVTVWQLFLRGINERGHAIGMFAAYMPSQHIARFPLCQGNQSAFMIFADDGVPLPITNARLLVDNSRALINADLRRHHLRPPYAGKKIAAYLGGEIAA